MLKNINVDDIVYLRKDYKKLLKTFSISHSHSISVYGDYKTETIPFDYDKLLGDKPLRIVWINGFTSSPVYIKIAILGQQGPHYTLPIRIFKKISSLPKFVNLIEGDIVMFRKGWWHDISEKNARHIYIIVKALIPETLTGEHNFNRKEAFFTEPHQLGWQPDTDTPQLLVKFGNHYIKRNYLRKVTLPRILSQFKQKEDKEYGY